MKRTIKILFLAANPNDTSKLRLDEEIRNIDEVLQKSEFRDKFIIQQQWAVRVSDLQGILLRYKPDIVHFSGHGSPSSEIILENDSGKSQAVPIHALSQLFFLLRDNIKCVVLNACYSKNQAQAIAKNIDCVIGMSKAIGDLSAINFSTSFYQAIGFGRDINKAFKLGCSQIDLQGLDEQDIPKLLAINKNPDRIVFTNIARNKLDLYLYKLKKATSIKPVLPYILMIAVIVTLLNIFAWFIIDYHIVLLGTVSTFSLIYTLIVYVKY